MKFISHIALSLLLLGNVMSKLESREVDRSYVQHDWNSLNNRLNPQKHKRKHNQIQWARHLWRKHHKIPTRWQLISKVDKPAKYRRQRKLGARRWPQPRLKRFPIVGISSKLPTIYNRPSTTLYLHKKKTIPLPRTTSEKSLFGKHVLPTVFESSLPGNARFNPLDPNVDDWEWVGPSVGLPKKDLPISTPPTKPKQHIPIDSQSHEQPSSLCLQCPPRKKVFAKQGHDSAAFFLPAPKSNCFTSELTNIESQTEVDSTIQQGNVLKEGQYTIHISIYAHNNTQPLKSCQYEYDVSVHKCRPLDVVAGSKVVCNAGNAWGSVCNYSSEPGKRLEGATSIVCKGHRLSPQWSHAPPTVHTAGCQLPSQSSKNIAVSCSRAEVSAFDKQSLDLLPEGTVCYISCSSNQYATFLSKTRPSVCLSDGTWSVDFADCCKKEPPTLLAGECKDYKVQVSHSSSIRLTKPKFRTSLGYEAEVWCDVDSVQREGRQCRTCIAKDLIHRTYASCSHCVTVTKRKECMPVEAPKNGYLACSINNKGVAQCSASCQQGYLMSPNMHENIFCDTVTGLWNFQTKAFQKLPTCVLR